MKIKLTIPEPCHEDWAKMSPTEKGRHCAVCEKEVFDMTKIPAEDVAEKISKMESGNVCAQIPTHYLDKPIQLHAAGIGKYGKMGAAATIITAVAFTPMISTPEIDLTELADKNTLQISNQPIHINGTVVNGNDENISGVRVIIEQNNSKAFTTSLANGRFIFNLDPQKIKNGNAIIKFEKDGFITKEHTIFINGNMQNGKFVIDDLQLEKANICMIGEIQPDIDYRNMVTAGQVVRTIECQKAELSTITESYSVTGGAVVHTEYINRIEPIYVTEKIKIESTLIDVETVFVNELKTYPNPTVDYVNLELKKEGNYSVYVFALDGRMVLTENFNADKLNLNLSAFERGNYIIKVTDNDTQESFDSKVVLMR